MTTCPKCNFLNEQPQATECPKCGLIYTKFQKAQVDENRNIYPEWALNENLKRVMSFDPENSSGFIDFEQEKDIKSYTMVQYLIGIFVVFAGGLVLFSVFEIKFLWALLASLQSELKFLSNSDVFFILLFVSVSCVLQIAIILAIAWILKLGKDIADNTRATRNYLAHIAQKVK